MTEDRRTKKELLERLAEVEAKNKQLEREAPAAPTPVPIADALASCIRALDGLSSRHQSYRDDTQTHQVLRVLAQKYGMTLKEKVLMPCDRGHLDEIDEFALGQAVKNIQQWGVTPRDIE